MRCTFIVVSGLVLVLALPAYAQETPAIEVSGGYSLVRDHDIEENFHGWLASVTVNLNSWLGVVAEAGGNYKTVSFDGEGVDVSLHSLLGGARISARQRTGVVPFGQFLIGVVRGSASAFGESYGETEFALQPGAGLELRVHPAFGIRVGGDYRRVFFADGTNQLRAHVGIVIGAGRR
jgi:hypothetical protein